MTRTQRLTLIKLCLCTLVAASALSGCRSAGAPESGPQRRPGAQRVAPRPMARPIRGIWVARFHYRYPDDVRTIMANCAAAGCNTVYWQVRGEGTVCYPSRIEPWGREFDYQYPGFDPLALAVEEAHKRGLRIEAWFNVMPGWKGATPPPIGSQVFNAHPEWFMHDASGQRQPLGREYVILNPCLPEVRRHINKLVEEIVARYDVDGLHMDYVRYAWDSTPNAKRAYPRDSRTLGLYRHDTGRDPDDDLTSWDSWRANQLTRLVDDIRRTVNKRRPGATLTAAVWRDPRIGYNDYLQNSVAWLRAGFVDALMPMVYTDRFGQFEADVDSYKRLVGKHPIVPGLGIYMHKSDEAMAEQLRQCQSWGGDFALFSYESLFPTAGDRGANAATRNEAQALRHMRRQVLEAYTGR